MASETTRTEQELQSLAFNELEEAFKVSIVSGSGTGGTASTDEATFTPGSSVGTPISAAVDEVAPDVAAEGTLAIVRATTNRALHVNLRDAAGVELSSLGGQQYDDGDARGSATGTLGLGDDGVNLQSLSVDTSGRQNININGTVTVDGSGVTQPVSAAALPLPSGAATAANQSTGNGSLGTIAGAVSGSEMQVDVVTSALPSGAATAANQSTGNGSLSTIAGAVSGSEMQVGVLTSALPSGASTAANQSTGNGSLSNLESSVVGASAPSVDSYTSVAISAAAATANQVLVAAPGASKEVWVFGIVGTADTGDGSISLQDEDDTALSGVMEVKQSGGFVLNPSGNFSMPWLKLATNKALEIDTVTCGFKGILTYAIVSV